MTYSLDLHDVTRNAWRSFTDATSDLDCFIERISLINCLIDLQQINILQHNVYSSDNQLALIIYYYLT